eukprot:s8723_g1.t1
MEPGGSCSRWSPAVPASEGDGQGDCTPSHRQTADSSSGGQSEQDAIVHFDWEPGQVLNRRYRLHALAGEGTFGRVCLATDTTKKRQVAIKIIRDVKEFREAAQEEAEILATICAADPWGQFRCCWMHTSFLHDSRFFCMVFEPLGSSLYEFIKKNDYSGFWLQDIQIIAKQLLYALNFLHTKMRPENVMLTSMEPARPEWFPREDFCEGEVLRKKKRRKRLQQAVVPASHSRDLVAQVAPSTCDHVVRASRSSTLVLGLGSTSAICSSLAAYRQHGGDVRLFVAFLVAWAMWSTTSQEALGFAPPRGFAAMACCPCWEGLTGQKESLQLVPRKVPISALILGTGPLGCGWAGDVSETEAEATILQAFSLGIHYVDTAPWYGGGLSEQRVGKALATVQKDKVVLSTKVGRFIVAKQESSAYGHRVETGYDFLTDGYHQNIPVWDYRKEGIEESFRQSRQRLGRSFIDCLRIHDAEDSDRWEEACSQDGAVNTLVSLRSRGEIGQVSLGFNKVDFLMKTILRFPVGTFASRLQL